MRVSIFLWLKARLFCGMRLVIIPLATKGTIQTFKGEHRARLYLKRLILFL